jgi:hypothetical protein
MEFKLNWTPNADFPYPNTWLKFKAKDLDSEKLVEYRICDLPENRFEDIFDLTVNDFLANCPGYSALGIIKTRWHQPDNSTNQNTFHILTGTKNSPESVNILRRICEAAHKQKLINVCIRDGSDEICGFNILYVISKADNVKEQIKKMVGVALCSN